MFITNIFTVSFFGHRDIDHFRKVEEQVEHQVQQLIEEHEYVEFLVGRDGDFDQIVSSAVKRAKKNIRDDNSALIWVLPYLTSEYQNNEDEYLKYYDEIEVCEESNAAHPKSAFQIRNRSMVERSDLVVFYVDHNSGGAYQTYQYAKKQDKMFINIADMIEKGAK